MHKTQGKDKKTELITVRATLNDLECFRIVGEILWPGAPVSKSATLLGLARLKADEILERKGVAKRK